MTDDTSIGELLAEQLQRLFSDTVDRDLFIAIEQGQAAKQLWNELEGLGINSALVSEEKGGAGLNWSEIEPTLRTLGHYGAPVPLAETLLAHWLLADVGIDAPMGPIAVSTQHFTLNDDNSLSGHDPCLAWAPLCTQAVVLAAKGDDHVLCLVNYHEAQLTAKETIAREPQASLQLTDQAVVASASTALNSLLPYLAIIRAAQMGGALEQLLSLSVEYGNTREQFGRPIGKFQALQHSIAQLASETAAAQVAALYACRQIDANNAEKGAMVAKSRAGQAAGRGAEIAHQVFGAIGFTDEHTLHYFTRRLWQWRSEAGSEFWWAEKLGQATIQQGGEALWPAVTQ